MSMPFNGKVASLLIVVGAILPGSIAVFAQSAPQVQSFAPARYSMSNSTTESISVQFDQAMDGSTIIPANLLVYASRTGFHSGALTYSSASQTATFETTTPFQAGEMVTVVLTVGIKAQNGSPLAKSFAWSFYIRATTGTAKFKSDSTYAAGDRPHFVEFGEFTGDNNLDVAVPNNISDNVYVWRNLGNGDLEETQTLAIGRRPRAVAAGDFDSDGDLDLASANERDDNISILDNTGAGLFTVLATTFAVGADPAHIATGDLNGDGLLDLVTANGDSALSSISVLLNSGGGNFQAETQYSVGRIPQTSFIADFNNDGSLDIVVANQGDDEHSDPDNISLLLNDGTGSFGAPQNFTVGKTPRFLTAHDFNGDGLLDVAAANRDDNTVSVLLNNGGTFSSPNDFPVGDDPFALTAGDFDGDLDADIAVVNRLDQKIYILLNNGSGFFQIDATYDTGTLPRAIDAGDFDGDGVLDLAVANSESDNLQMFTNEFKFVPNQPPAAPGLVTPDDLTFFNLDPSAVLLSWGVPTDPENDSLHFKLEISQTPDFASPTQTFDSAIDPTGFSPLPPVDPSVSLVSCNLSEPIPDGPYWWRVTASDGALSGPPSGARRFTIDRVLPVIDQVVITAPGFSPNWYNQNATSSINFGAQYDEVHAQQLDFDLGDLGGAQTVTGISSGLDQVRQLPITLSGEADGSYSLAIALFDSAGNEANISTQIALDATAPNGTLASSADTSGTKIFEVTWGGGTDGNGSGLSGSYDVRLRVNGGDWVDWQTNVQGTSAQYAGNHGQTYEFEARTYDNLGNAEPFQSIPETQTLVDTNAFDISPPDGPVTLTVAGASPSVWQSNPQFQVDWQAPADQSGISRALYKLGTPPTADFDTTATVSAGSSITVLATQENGQGFHIWFQDRKGNLDFTSHGTIQLRYDNTLPDLVDVDIRNADLGPNWFDQGETPKAEVEINYDEVHLQQIRLVSADLGTSIDVDQPASGTDIFHLFDLSIQGKSDGNYKLFITLTDSAGNATLDSTAIGLDDTPPIAQASSIDTSESLSFTVGWGSAATDGSGSGLSGSYDVRYQEDGGTWQDWLSNFSGNSEVFTGENGRTYGFEVATADRIGNQDLFTETAETVTVVDTGFIDVSPPSLFHSPPLVVEEGEPATIEAVIGDNVNVVSATLFYKQSGAVSFQSMDMTDVGDGDYEATLTAEQIGSLGINYFVSASDGVNFSFHPFSNWDTLPNNLSVRISGPNNEGLSRGAALPAGEEQFFYRMISVPVALEEPGALSVLEDDLGSYDPNRWRLFQYNTAADEYREFPDVSLFLPGSAFWIIVRDPDKVVDSGPGSSVATNQPFLINLDQGWNDFGPPFSFPVDWSSVRVAQGSLDDIMGPYTYREQWLLPNEVSTLMPWEGYSIFSQSSDVQIEIQPIRAQGQTAAKATGTPIWQIGIEATCGTTRDRSNFLGVADASSRDWDALDYLEPPYISDFVSVTFPHDEWSHFQGDFTTDFRPEFEDGQVWHFKVRTNVPNEVVKLKFQNLASLPSRFQAVLLDKATLTQIEVQQNSEYAFTPDPGSRQREFDLVIGTKDYIEHSESLQAAPESFFLSQNYPNPFNAGTTLTYHVSEASFVTIKVLNVLGQEVRQLLSQKQNVGTYRIQWNGDSDNGRDISSGIYIVKFEAGNFQQIRKVVLVR